LPPLRRFPALPRLRGGSRTGHDSQVDQLRAGRRRRLRRRRRLARWRHRVARGVARGMGLEGSPGRRGQRTPGALWWDIEELNRLHVFYSRDEADRTGGFRDILVTQPDHPFLDLWWP